MVFLSLNHNAKIRTISDMTKFFREKIEKFFQEKTHRIPVCIFLISLKLFRCPESCTTSRHSLATAISVVSMIHNLNEIIFTGKSCDVIVVILVQSLRTQDLIPLKLFPGLRRHVVRVMFFARTSCRQKKRAAPFGTAL